MIENYKMSRTQVKEFLQKIEERIRSKENEPKKRVTPFVSRL